MTLRVNAMIVSACLVSATAYTSETADFSSCTSALEDLSSAAEDAESQSRDAESAEDEFKSQKEDYDSCRRFPDVYDLLEDGCRSSRQDVQDAQETLQSSVDTSKPAICGRVKTGHFGIGTGTSGMFTS
jgi:hypothetical protein